MRKNNRILDLMLVLMLMATLTGCELAGDIFKAGMGVGIFIIVAIVVIIIWVISRFRR